MLAVSKELKEASVTKGHCTRRRMGGKEARQVASRRAEPQRSLLGTLTFILCKMESH